MKESELKRLIAEELMNVLKEQEEDPNYDAADMRDAMDACKQSQRSLEAIYSALGSARPGESNQAGVLARMVAKVMPNISEILDFMATAAVNRESLNSAEDRAMMNKQQTDIGALAGKIEGIVQGYIRSLLDNEERYAKQWRDNAPNQGDE